jgi:hypothetical protein
VTDKDISDVHKRLNQVIETVELKKKRLADIEASMFVSYLNPNNPWNVIRRALRCGLIDQISSSRKSIILIQEEISRFEEIYVQLSNDLVNLQAIQKRLEYSKTFKGKYFHVLGHFFSLYCIWKIFISFINIVFNRVGKGKLILNCREREKRRLFCIVVDPVTIGIEITVHYFNLQFDLQFWSQYVSFILIGIIVVTSIRGLLITLTKV